MSGMWFDDVQLAMRFESPSRTITEADLVAFSGLSEDHNALQPSDGLMRTSQWGERIVHGAVVPSIVTGLHSRLGLLADSDRVRRDRGWRSQPQARPDVMVQRVGVHNQRDELVQEGEMITLLKREAAT